MKKCIKCGGDLSFSLKTQQLACSHCELELSIKHDESIEKRNLEIQKQLEKKEQEKEEIYSDEEEIKAEDGVVFHCSSCGADSHFDKYLISEKCSFCGSNLITKNPLTFNYPDNIIPFEISKEAANKKFKEWIGTLWFAPNSLKKLVDSVSLLEGCYIPFWCFDSNSHTTYDGIRGDYYYVMESITTNGKTQYFRKQKIKWKSVSGTVNHSFKNHLELAQTILPVLSKGSVLQVGVVRKTNRSTLRRFDI